MQKSNVAALMLEEIQTFVRDYFDQILFKGFVDSGFCSKNGELTVKGKRRLRNKYPGMTKEEVRNFKLEKKGLWRVYLWAETKSLINRNESTCQNPK
jgi:hypothetical protein